MYIYIHITIRMKPTDVEESTYVDYDVERKKILNLQLVII